MKISCMRVAGFVLVAVLSYGMISPSLHAGPVAEGKFKLPFDAQFGKMALPKGDYSFSIEGLSLTGNVLILHESRPVGFVRPQSFNDREAQNKVPVLVCIRHDGNVTVRALRLPHVGTFYFPLAKDLSVLAAQQPQLIETVSVEVSGD